jgi:2-oxoisovalerate dehydrogenase E1 component
MSGLASRFGAFVAERTPFALDLALDALAAALGADRRSTSIEDPHTAAGIDALRPAVAREIRRRAAPPPPDLGDPSPGVSAGDRLGQALDALVEECDGFLAREAIARSLSADERREILRGMALTRAVDNRLKSFFTGSQVRYEGAPFQGKGFRSLGQEAIYAAGIRLRRGQAWRGDDGAWRGDVVAPVIRDLGVALAMRPSPATVRMTLSAQMAKAGPPMEGKDLHIGDFQWGILPATAPLSIGAMSIAGLALAFQREGSGRVALSFIGEGGSSLGEWHEAINLCAARRLPAVFCIENNQTALSTPVPEQSAVRTFADKAIGYGAPGVTIDGVDPDAVAAAFAWAVERARAGLGPSLIELVCMRMCGHAHHDDMLYLGRDPQPGWSYPKPTGEGYVNAELYAWWAARDPIALYAARLEAEGVIAPGDFVAIKAEVETIVEQEAQAVIEAAWPEPQSAAIGVHAGEPPRVRIETLEPAVREAAAAAPPALQLEPGPPFDRKGATFLEAITLGVGDALRRDPRTFVYGQDVGGRYGNAFLLLRPLLAEFGDRIINSPLAEGAVLGVCVGAALGGLRPIGEMQFNETTSSPRGSTSS